MINLTFISECRIAAAGLAAGIEAIRRVAARHNHDTGVTGAMLFTGTAFVETLEGDAAVVDDLLARIARDPRHARLVTIDRRPVGRRSFAGWSLSYAGPSLYVAQIVARGLDGFNMGLPGDVARLVRLMGEFGTAPVTREQ